MGYWSPLQYLAWALINFTVPLAIVIFLVRWFGRRKTAIAKASPATDWSGFDSYTDLARAAGEALHLPPDQFLQGPFRRFLEMSSVRDDYPRARARIMEFCRSTFLAYRKAQGDLGVDPAELTQRARVMAAESFGELEPQDRAYMLEVFDGFSNHNYRGTPGVLL